METAEIYGKGVAGFAPERLFATNWSTGVEDKQTPAHANDPNAIPKNSEHSLQRKSVLFCVPLE